MSAHFQINLFNVKKVRNNLHISESSSLRLYWDLNDGLFVCLFVFLSTVCASADRSRFNSQWNEGFWTSPDAVYQQTVYLN